MRFSHWIVPAASLMVCAFATGAGGQQPSQSQPRVRFVELDYMKVTPGKESEYVRLEQEVWKPFHQARIAKNQMVSWQLYAVPYTADTHREYDYVTANIYDNLPATEGSGFLDTFRGLHPGSAGTTLLSQTGAARQIVRSEIWQLLDETAPANTANTSAPPSKYLMVDFMRSKPGGNYVTVERELWKPIHQERVRSGAGAGWALYRLVMPGGTSYPYDYATVNAMSSLSGLTEPYPDELFKRVHPNVALTDIGTRTGASRDLTRAELWVLVDATH